MSGSQEQNLRQEWASPGLSRGDPQGSKGGQSRGRASAEPDLSWGGSPQSCSPLFGQAGGWPSVLPYQPVIGCRLSPGRGHALSVENKCQEKRTRGSSCGGWVPLPGEGAMPSLGGDEPTGCKSNLCRLLLTDNRQNFNVSERPCGCLGVAFSPSKVEPLQQCRLVPSLLHSHALSSTVRNVGSRGQGADPWEGQGQKGNGREGEEGGGGRRERREGSGQPWVALVAGSKPRG